MMLPMTREGENKKKDAWMRISKLQTRVRHLKKKLEGDSDDDISGGGNFSQLSRLRQRREERVFISTR